MISATERFPFCCFSLRVLATLLFVAQFVAGVETDVSPFRASPRGAVNGVRRRWHRITIGFEGPNTDELAIPNPFTDCRLDVTFVLRDSPVEHTYTVPGFYAADGNAANTGARSGNVWLVHFAPDEIGIWDWSARFVAGRHVALDNVKLASTWASAGFFDGASGMLDVEETDKTGGRDHRGKGRLSYVGRHHLRFADGDWFLKGGSDSPENLLAYDDFDNTPNYNGLRKSWAPHVQDYRPRDRTWMDGKGKGILGALNYLALEKRMNAFSFISMNIAGDDQNVFPYVSDNPENGAYERIDVSKTAQWECVFQHADRVGLFIHFKTQETENDKLLDGGFLGNQRKLYYRELVARFSHHLALNWNLGEENTNTRQQRLSFATYFKSIDPYAHPVVIHTKPDQLSKNRIYGPLVGESDMDGASLQSNLDDIFNDTLTWRSESDQAGHPWVVTNDEQGPHGVGIVPDEEDFDPNHKDARANVLWANLMAGGAGVEYYFGSRYPENDLTLQDFRSRDQFWDQTRYALRFFRVFDIPYWDMQPVDEPNFGGHSALATEDRSTIVFHLQNTHTLPTVLITGGPKTAYAVRWYDPRNGGLLQQGSATKLFLSDGDNLQDIGTPPPVGGSPDDDWIVLLSRTRGTVGLRGARDT